jgi:hypothetical protein
MKPANSLLTDPSGTLPALDLKALENDLSAILGKAVSGGKNIHSLR